MLSQSTCKGGAQLECQKNLRLSVFELFLALFPLLTFPKTHQNDHFSDLKNNANIYNIYESDSILVFENMTKFEIQP